MITNSIWFHYLLPLKERKGACILMPKTSLWSSVIKVMTFMIIKVKVNEFLLSLSRLASKWNFGIQCKRLLMLYQCLACNFKSKNKETSSLFMVLFIWLLWHPLIFDSVWSSPSDQLSSVGWLWAPTFLLFPILINIHLNSTFCNKYFTNVNPFNHHYNL